MNVKNVVLALGAVGLLAGCAGPRHTPTSTTTAKPATAEKPKITAPAARKEMAPNTPATTPKEVKEAASPAQAPAPPKGAEDMIDLAIGANVTASSTQAKWEGEGPVSAVIDGKPGTRWSSEYADNQVLTIDLGAEKPVAILRLFWETASAKDYSVSVSTDGKTWKQVSEQKNQEPKARVDLIRLEDISARYVRLNLQARTTEYGFSLYEVEIWGRK